MNSCPRVMDEAGWYANGTLPASSRRSFETHLETCAECRAAVELDTQLMQSMRRTAANVLPAPQVAWMRLKARLEEGGSPPDADPTLAGPGAGPAPPGKHRLLQLAVVAQAATILLLVGGLWALASRYDAGAFRTVGDGDAALLSPEPLVRVVLAPGHTAADAGDIARSVGAEVRGQVEGTEIYTLTIVVPAGTNRSERVATAVTTLRRRSEVLMAEPITDPQVPDGGR